jgi:nitrogen fixation NifU-like protein
MIAEPTHKTDELRDLYRELILDHAKNPRHFGKLVDATHTAAGINPLCGDKLSLYLHLDGANTIDAISFEGSGCAISIASASLLTETIVGLDVSHALAYFDAVTGRLTHAGNSREIPESIDISKLRALDGVREFPARVKCATLAWHALNSAIHQHSVPASTE